MARIPFFLQMCERAITTHIKKNEDYSGPASPFENFDRAAYLTSWFENHQDKAYVNHIATKLARLATLLNKEYAGFDGPNNEAVEDSFLDLFNYVGLWASDHYYRTHPLDGRNNAGVMGVNAHRKTDYVTEGLDKANDVSAALGYAYPATQQTLDEADRRKNDKPRCAYCHEPIEGELNSVSLVHGLVAHKLCYANVMGRV